MRYALVVGLLLAGAVCAAPPSVVPLIAYTGEDGRGERISTTQCAGWLDDKGRVWTAAHCVGPDHECLVETMDGVGAAYVVQVPGRDVAVGHSVGVDARPLTRAKRQPTFGQVLTWHGIDDRWRPESGSVAVLAVGRDVVITTDPGPQLAEGDSGAPLTDASGRVVGVLVSRRRGMPCFVRVDEEASR